MRPDCRNEHGFDCRATLSKFKNWSIDRLYARRAFLSLKPDLLIIQAVQPPRFDLALLSAMWSLDPMGGDHRSRLTGHREAILTLVAHRSDLTLAEIRAELAARHGITVGQTTIWRFFERHRITVKKKPARHRAGAA